jgi:glycosyltransferase involved in cell wall biosynthesis
MNVLVNTSARFSVTPDGQLWAPSENLAYKYWARFLDVFDEVYVLGRAFPLDHPAAGARPATGQGVSIIQLPNYSGIVQFAATLPAVRKVVRQALARTGAVYLSVPCLIGDLVWQMLGPHRPFGVGVCGDPYDAFAPGASKHPLRAPMRWWFSRRLRKLCTGASACTYVTKSALQRRYPCRDSVFATYYSSIDLLPEAVVENPPPPKTGPPFKVIHVGTFDTWYKAPDVLLRAIAGCVKRGLDLNAIVIGDGRHRAEAENLASAIGIADRVKFLGQLPFSAAVRAELDTADLFVLPSRQEGLPKALVEAMARGLPCIATTIGGIPELLAAEDLVPPDDPEALTTSIAAVLRDPQRRERMAARNLATSRDYLSPILRQRRIALYRALHQQTSEWLASKSVRPMATGVHA